MYHYKSEANLLNRGGEESNYSKLLNRQKQHGIMKSNLEQNMTLKLKDSSNRQLNRDKINNLMESIEKDPKLVKMFINEASSRGIYVNQYPVYQDNVSTKAGESQFDVSKDPYGSAPKYSSVMMMKRDQNRSTLSQRSTSRRQLGQSFYKSRVQPSQKAQLEVVQMRSKSNLSSRLNQSATRGNFFNKRSNRDLSLPSLNSIDPSKQVHKRNVSNNYQSERLLNKDFKITIIDEGGTIQQDNEFYGDFSVQSSRREHQEKQKIIKSNNAKFVKMSGTRQNRSNKNQKTILSKLAPPESGNISEYEDEVMPMKGSHHLHHELDTERSRSSSFDHKKNGRYSSNERKHEGTNKGQSKFDKLMQILTTQLFLNSQKLKDFFHKVSTKLKLDQDKLYHAVKQTFYELAPGVFHIIKKIFHNFRSSINFEEYCSLITKFLNMDHIQCNEIFFSFLDINKDKFICETDLFRILKSLSSNKMIQLLEKDFIIVIRNIKDQRMKQGKENPQQLIQSQTLRNAKQAFKKSQTFEKPDHNLEIKLFLKEVKHHQDRINKKQHLGNQIQEEEDHDCQSEEDAYVPNNMKPFMNKEINFDLFLEMLTNKIDLQRVMIGHSEFNEVTFKDHGLPQLVTELMCFLSQMSKGSLFEKKLKQAPTVFNSQLTVTSNHDPDYLMKEYNELVLIKMNYQKKVNFKIYEQFFRTFCKNKDSEHPHALIADLKSFNEGITYWYGGKENLQLATLIFNYMGKGYQNHKTTFTQFIDFSQEFELSNRNQNLIVYHIISDNQKILKILRLLQVFVSSPKGCPFSMELNKILDFYVIRSLKQSVIQEKQVYDKNAFNKIVPFSILCTELKNLFLHLPKLAYLPNGDENPDFDPKDPSLQQSCLFAPKIGKKSEELQDYVDQLIHPAPAGRNVQKKKGPYELGDEIYKYSGLFQLQINVENLPYVLEELTKACRANNVNRSIV